MQSVQSDFGKIWLEVRAPRSGPRGTGFIGEAPSGNAPIGK